MSVVEKIEKYIEPSLTDLGYDIVRIMIQGGDIKTVQIMAERKDRVNMMVSDCEKISRTVSALLDVEDPIPGRWNLEVSSPGIDRPLITLEDYERFKGDEAKIETLKDMNGRKRFKGVLKGVAGDKILFDFEGAPMEFDLSNIAKAKLILTDELIKKYQKNDAK